MSRVLFIATNTATDPYPVYPLGMAVVSAALVARGHPVRQFDFLAAGQRLEAVTAAVRAAAPDVVCLSVRNVDDVDSTASDGRGSLGDTHRVVAAVRAATTAPLIVGGPAVSILPDEIRAALGVDYAIVGEGERALPDLLDRLAAGTAPAPGVLRPAATPLAGDAVPAPLLDPDLSAYYLATAGVMGVPTKRGCPYRCAYCTYPLLEGAAFRPLPTAAVIESLERLRGQPGFDSVFFTDSVFNDPAGHFRVLVEELVRRDLRVRWSAYFSPRHLTRADLALCKRAGLFAVELGTDAASDATLAGLEKDFDVAAVAAANAACIAEQIPVAHFVMFGGPGETRETVAEGLANLERLEHCVVFAYAGVRIYPGTSVHRRAQREGWLAPAASLLPPTYYFAAACERHWLTDTLTAAWRGRRDRLFPPAVAQERLAVMHDFGYKGALWDKLVTFKTRR